MSKTLYIITGLIIGLLVPMVFDWLVFGSIAPCKTVTRYEDGSSVQHCQVKN